VAVDPNVKNLIFDLGGVIIDLSVKHTVEAFERLTGMTGDQIQHAYHSEPVFFDYETGRITSKEFRDGLRSLFGVQATDDELDQCWNAMLIHLPVRKLAMLQSLKKDYNVFLLSNTNDIHLEYVNRHMIAPIAPGTILDAFFHKSYYSHLVGMRKPDQRFFEIVLEENDLDPTATLFMDDMPNNIQSAAAVGIKTIHIEHPDSILTLFENYV
jgi:putative hydrolase of the HAD superfamily